MNSAEAALATKQLPLASVIILNYNGRDYITNCLAAVLRSDYPNLEILFVDNASTDDSLRHIEPFGERVRLIRNPANYLSSKGLNAGIRAAEGDFIVLLDLDTQVRPDWLSCLVQPLMDNPSVGLTGSKLLYPDGRIQHAGGWLCGNAHAAHYGIEETDHGQWDRTREVPFVTGAAIAVRREIFKQLGGGLDEMLPFYYEDIDLCWHVRRLGYKVVYAGNSVAMHHESTSFPRNTPRYLFHFHRGRCRFMLKNYPIRQLLTKSLPNELIWFLHHPVREKWWWPVVKAYGATLAVLPIAIHRRVGRLVRTAG